ncbi:DNA-directed RNA polymerase subunit beta' [candidate division CPR3 bacterium GWF2_35_18]|uniref:DNA-directed RNA polymerase subunit beta' n=1 Tax=candidate division CPR3 bacterium GW2011_GWF2_35_18 TaxID=1618350 RepID=A0A0G0E367_UNCC3|nr:MAG: DNA-directed RNA polymerase subunit beta' [candidate division CPR3 bacterium GW2011_GWF2_35_18]OGB63178.1 MAG: DNA-directed RNA polymerase subunit beta' [candidate division CPR3 bacterium GWF2_35_18]OGB64008.1 MAG: DNA-directed RNA polymerase subunit beta' [candidate division CPR3 bacterium RIFOXYA2_FULL_35_13]OGB79597.1 MAG: DNA-directed RNA polymerase subunit beta' [candidate division CPR3 bacterium RIFOXYB2_FULL_35_8]
MLDRDFKALKISLASPEAIHSWSHGEVTKPETINYRTLKPEKDGLFCEKIFGPTKDFECYCGKYKRVRYKGIICDKCGVEVTYSRVRRERMGHIDLAVPVSHVWYVRGTPSKLSLLLNISPRDLEEVIYFAAFVVMDVDVEKKKDVMKKLETEFKERKDEVEAEREEKISELRAQYKIKIKDLDKKSKNKTEKEIKKQELEREQRKQEIFVVKEAEEQLENLIQSIGFLKNKIKKIKPLDVISEEEMSEIDNFELSDFMKVGIGAEALLELTHQQDLDALSKRLRKDLKSGSTQKRIKSAKRLQVVDGFLKANIDPTWMILKVIPVIPPDLRPMVQLSGGRFATSDLNDLYRRVINRNSRLKHLMDLGAPDIILRNEKRMLQEAVDALIDASPRERLTTKRKSRRKLRSLSEILRGKQGRFRQNLLGKRVDYSGRSVIVAGPELNMDECGLPKEMALELFKPFVISQIIAEGLASNMKSAKHVLEKRSAQVWDILERITLKYPVLLNRAPTLHRLGIQAFYPVLIGGNALKLHPSVCNAFNADFDGDQMAIHVPLSKEAVQEAKDIMLSPNNILKPSSGDPIINFKNELGMGVYYLTVLNKDEKGSGRKFSNYQEAKLAYRLKQIHLQAEIEVMNEKSERVKTTVGRILFNEILPEDLRFINKSVDKGVLQDLLSESFLNHGKEETVKFIDDIKNLGRHYATIAGASFSIFDLQTPKEREQMIEKADGELEEIENDFRRGLMTSAERRNLIIQLWEKVTEDVFQKAWKEIKKNSMMDMVIASKSSRATPDTVRQLAGMRGVMTDSFGRIIETPIKTNIIEGCSTFDGFISNRAARKGLIDTALMTAEAGYLTRRLVDVAHDIITKEEDCGSDEGLTIFEPNEEDFVTRLEGRFLVEDLKDKKGNVICSKDEEISIKKALEIFKLGFSKLKVRSVLYCKTSWGVCCKCYGKDLATGNHVKIGTTVGVIAAQSIGEPGTQLTLRTFHKGGIAGTDITQGLPRVEELFESRVPKDKAAIALGDGRVTLIEKGEEKILTLLRKKKDVKEYHLIGDEEVKVKDGQLMSETETIFINGKKKPVRAPYIGVVEVSKNSIKLIKEIEAKDEYLVEANRKILVKSGDEVRIGQQLTEGHIDLQDIMATRGIEAVYEYIIKGIQLVYQTQGIKIADKHIEVIVKKMFDKIRITKVGDTDYIYQDVTTQFALDEVNKKIQDLKGEIAEGEQLILGITRSALYTESFLSASSFQTTTKVLTDAASKGKIDYLRGLKENVIIGRLIPTGERVLNEN